MARIRPSLSTGLLAGVVATAIGMAVPVGLAVAQDAGGLRGAAKDETPQEQPAASNPYVPVSAGAIPDPEPRPTSSTASLFDDPDGEETVTPVEAPLPEPRTPSTARVRKAGETLAEAEPEAVPVEEEAGIDNERTATVDAAERLDLNGRSLRADTIEELDRAVEENPFAPVGIRVGTFILRPSLEQGVTVTNNANFSTDPESAVLSETTLRLNAVSDWSRHSASLDAYGNFRKSLSGYDLDETRAGVDAALNLDLGETLRGRTTFAYEREPETASSPVAIEGSVTQPLRQTYSGSAALEKDLGKARFAVTGRLEHDNYGDAELEDGTTLSQDDRNSTLATLVLRGGYEISPALVPFVEGEIGRRRYEEEVDTAGYERSSDRVGARAGLAVDLNEKIVGELSAGWIREEFDDKRLRAISGPTVSAELTWSPQRGTSVNLFAETVVEGGTGAGESGSILHSGRISVERQIRADLTANAAVGGGYRDYSGSDGRDVLLNAEVGGTWWLNRYAGLTGRLRYESQDSNIEFRDYDAASAFLGLKIQR